MTRHAPAAERGNLLHGAIASTGEECFDTLLQCGAVRIERIASNSHASPPGTWYDQAGTEWVVVIRGEASLEFADGTHARLASGDWITLPPHCRHRIAGTTGDTLWLAVHVDEEHVRT